LEHGFYYILGTIIPTDELMFFRGVAQPPAVLGFSAPAAAGAQPLMYI